MTDPDSHLFGCGFLKWNRFHGNGSNEFWVYPKTEDFMHRLQYDDFDYTVETFADAAEFCWNCHEVEVTAQYKRFKCLGHPEGDTGTHNPKDIQYADTTYGSVRVNSEAMFINIKQAVHALKDAYRPDAEEGFHLACGQFDEQYYGFPADGDKRKQLCEWLNAFYHAHSKDPMTGFKVFLEARTFRIGKAATVIWWSASPRYIDKSLTSTQEHTVALRLAVRPAGKLSLIHI